MHKACTDYWVVRRVRLVDPIPQGERGSYLPLDSGEVLSGYLSYADYPKQKISLGCPTSVARGHVQGLQLVLRCAVWVGVTPKTHSIGYQKLSKLRVH